MIRSYADTLTATLAATGKAGKGFPNSILKVARRKLVILDAAVVLSDLETPPGNKLHPLKGDRLGQHAIRINDQFRLCFRWTDAGPEDVEIIDYHD